ncbi:MAG: NACHT domain-containing protein [Acidobacteriota bacterium]
MVNHQDSRLRCRDLIDFANRTGVTEILDLPIDFGDGWEVYDAAFISPHARFAFHFVYLSSDIKIDALHFLLETYVLSSLLVVAPRPVLERKNVREMVASAKHGVYSSEEYIISFAKSHIDAYRSLLMLKEPEYYVDPGILKEPGISPVVYRSRNPVLNLLRGRDGFPKGGLLIALLAEAGHGKTFLSRHSAAILAKGQKSFFPIHVSSRQWRTLPIESQKSLWKVIAHSFRFYDASIHWLEGQEEVLLRAVLKTGMFCIIFDGFDEFILRNRGLVNPIEVLGYLTELVNETGVRILLTSRTAFWENSVKGSIYSESDPAQGFLRIQLALFSQRRAKRYFEKSFPDSPSNVKKSVSIYGKLRYDESEIIGRGFVLYLIARLAEEAKVVGAPEVDSTNAQRLLWLFASLCDREIVRQEIAFGAADQLLMLREVAKRKAGGGKVSKGEIGRIARSVRNDSPGEHFEVFSERAHYHPLLRFNEQIASWEFSEEQVGSVLIAEYMATCNSSELREFLSQVKFKPGVRQDIVSFTVDFVVNRGGGSVERAADELSVLLSEMSFARGHSGDASGSDINYDYEGRYLGGLLATVAVSRWYRDNTSRRERGEALRALCGGSVEGLNFSGVVNGFDFSELEFRSCLFDNVYWSRCSFSPDTTFVGCCFRGLQAVGNSRNFGLVEFQSCLMDEEAEVCIRALTRISAHGRYTEDDLRSDLEALLHRFVGQSGFRYKSIADPNLSRGAIAHSRYGTELLAAAKRYVLDFHTVPGTSERAYTIRKRSERDFRALIDNNMLIGSLADLYDHLRGKLVK